MGVAYMYSLLIKLFFLPLTLVRKLLFSSNVYRGYGQSSSLMTLGKVLTVLVMLFLVFKKDVFVGIPNQWMQILGGVCLAIACLSLFVTAQGLVRVFAQASFWLFTIYFMSDTFFPELLGRFKSSHFGPPSYQVASNDIKRENAYKVPDLMTDFSNYSTGRTSTTASDLISEPGIGGGGFYTKYVLQPVKSALSYLGLSSGKSFSVENSSAHSKSALPDEAYFPPPKKKPLRESMLPQGLVGRQ
jgi:hypothetical protein